MLQRCALAICKRVSFLRAGAGRNEFFIGAQYHPQVGYISAYRLGETVRGINAFVRGLHSVDPEIQVYLVWQLSWFNPRKERVRAASFE